MGGGEGEAVHAVDKVGKQAIFYEELNGVLSDESVLMSQKHVFYLKA